MNLHEGYPEIFDTDIHTYIFTTFGHTNTALVDARYYNFDFVNFAGIAQCLHRYTLTSTCKFAYYAAY